MMMAMCRSKPQSTLDLIDAIIQGGTIDVGGTFDATAQRHRGRQ